MEQVVWGSGGALYCQHYEFRWRIENVLWDGKGWKVIDIKSNANAWPKKDFCSVDATSDAWPKLHQTDQFTRKSDIIWESPS